MAKEIEITWREHTPAELRKLAHRSPRVEAIRLLAVAGAMEGWRRGDVAELFGTQTQTLRDWVLAYNAWGPSGLREGRGGNRKPRMSVEQREIVRGWIEAGPEVEVDGVVAWRVKDIQAKIRREFGIEYAYETVRRLLHSLGFSHQTPRPMHPKADTARQEEFRASFADRVGDLARSAAADPVFETDGDGNGATEADAEAEAETRGDEAKEIGENGDGGAQDPETETRTPEVNGAAFAGFERSEPPQPEAFSEGEAIQVELWVQDEARIGQKGTLTSVWHQRGTRPRIPRDHRYGYCYLFLAACPSTGEAAGRIADRANTGEMNEHLAMISEQVRPGALGIVLLDGAGWHRSKDLEVPANLRLLHIPPYSPELNSAEQLIAHLKSTRFANRVFRSVEDVKDACESAWDWLRHQKDRISSITARDWADITSVPLQNPAT